MNSINSFEIITQKKSTENNNKELKEKMAKKKNQKKEEKKVNLKDATFYDESLQENILISKSDPNFNFNFKKSIQPSGNFFFFIYDENWVHHIIDYNNIKKSLKMNGKNNNSKTVLDEEISEYENTFFFPLKKSEFNKEQFLKDLKKLPFDNQYKIYKSFKTIIYYSGHGSLLNNEGKYKDFPGFKNSDGHRINTKELFEEICGLKNNSNPNPVYCFVTFIADMCSTTPTLTKEEEEIEFGKEKVCKISYFEFLGKCYIRTSQKGTPSRGNIPFGSYFLNIFSNYWNGDWIELIKFANKNLSKYQIASKEGNIRLDYFEKVDEQKSFLKKRKRNEKEARKIEKKKSKKVKKEK